MSKQLEKIKQLIEKREQARLDELFESYSEAARTWKVHSP